MQSVNTCVCLIKTHPYTLHSNNMMEAQPPDVAYRHSPQQKYSTEEKLKLVDSFRGFSGNTVSGNSIELARKCIQYRGSPRDRYQYIRFDYILDLNRVRSNVEHVLFKTMNLVL